MDNFDYKKYLTEGRIHENIDTTLDEKKQGYNDELDDSEGAKHGKKKQSMAQRRADSENMEKADGKRKFSGDKSKDKVKEVEDIKSESKTTVSELKARIRETILAELSEDGGYKADDAGAQYHDSLYTEADEEVDVDIDVEDEVDVDVEADDIEIERPAVKAKINVGLSPEEEIIQDSLKAAMDAANQLGNDKLADQIGNTITFFTREYVVGNRDD